MAVVDIARDSSGVWAASVLDGDGHELSLARSSPLVPDGELVCFDCRALLDLGADPRRVVDLQLSNEGTLARSAQRLGALVARELSDAELSVRSHARAARASGVDLTQHSLFSMVPPGLLRRVFELRARALRGLRELGPLPDPDLMLVMPALRRMELSGTCVMTSGAPLIRRTSYSPVGVRTGRMRTTGGFSAMNIAHGPAREAVVSRFEGGRVCSLDFNAIDYRCIVRSIPELAALYDGCDDFHLRTRELCSLTGFTREQVKFGAYVYVYGGSFETLRERTGLSDTQTHLLLSGFQDNLGLVRAFRERLHAQALSDGFVSTPGGKRVSVGGADHPGKVLGLYAQTFSSETFGRALAAADAALLGRRSTLMFPVHDELVADVHPAEPDVPDVLRQAMEAAAGPGFSVRMKLGKDYGEASA